MKWVMTVTSEAGVARENVTPADAVASLDSFSVDRAGNCLEASFAALPSEVDIQPRDVIRLRGWHANSYWLDLWCGVIVQAGNPRSHDVRPYRAVGLKQRFYEVLLRESVIDGADVASMAHAVATLATDHIRGISVPASFATTGFELGDRFPGLETMGDFMDALAASVGAFTAPSGGHAYDGTNYDEGDAVPAVVWGVDASGLVFFKRPQAAALALNETGASTRVTWTEANAEEYANSVTLVYLTEVQSEHLIAWGRLGNAKDQTEPLVVAPLSRTFTSASAEEEASVIVPLPSPLDYMGKVTLARTVNYGTITDEANLTDGDLDTYATLTDDSSVSVTPVVAARGPGLFRVRMAWYAGFDITLYVTLLGTADGGGTTTSTLVYAIKGADRESGGEPVDLWLPALPLAAAKFASVSTATPGVQIITEQVSSSSQPKLYEVEYYLPDCDTSVPGSASTPLASAFLRSIPEGVATVEVIVASEFPSVTQAIDLTTVTGEELALRVERAEFSITTSEGVIVRYHMGQPFASDLEAQRAVLERLARRATARALP